MQSLLFGKFSVTSSVFPFALIIDNFKLFRLKRVFFLVLNQNLYLFSAPPAKSLFCWNFCRRDLSINDARDRKRKCRRCTKICERSDQPKKQKHNNGRFHTKDE